MAQDPTAPRSTLSLASQRGHSEVGRRFRKHAEASPGELPVLQHLRLFQQATQLSLYRLFTGTAESGGRASDKGLQACWRKGAQALGSAKIEHRSACDKPCQACTARRVPCDGMLPCSRCINCGCASACCYPGAKVDAPDPVLELPLRGFRRTTLDERRELEEQLQKARARLLVVEASLHKEAERGRPASRAGERSAVALRAEVASQEEALFQAFAMLSPQKIELEPHRARRRRERQRQQQQLQQRQGAERIAQAQHAQHSRRQRALHESPLALPLVTPAQQRREQLASRRQRERKGRRLPAALAASFKAGMPRDA